MILLKLFIAFFRVGCFAIGGAYSFLPLMEKEIVNNYHWLEKSEFLEVVGMAELFPGAISIKASTGTSLNKYSIPKGIRTPKASSFVLSATPAPIKVLNLVGLRATTVHFLKI